MRTKIVTLLVLLCSFLSTTKAQEFVIDVALPGVIVGQMTADAIAYGQIEENQTENTTALAAAGTLQTAILQIKSTTLSALQEVQTILQGIMAGTQAVEAFTNSIRIASDIWDLTVDDPTLLLVSQELWFKVYEETVETTTYISNIALNEQGSELILLNNAERLQIITYVKKQAFKIQGIMNQMYYRMKAAKKYGLFRMLCPREFYYIRHCNQLATRIINNFHF